MLIAFIETINEMRCEAIAGCALRMPFAAAGVVFYHPELALRVFYTSSA